MKHKIILFLFISFIIVVSSKKLSTTKESKEDATELSGEGDAGNEEIIDTDVTDKTEEEGDNNMITIEQPSSNEETGDEVTGYDETGDEETGDEETGDEVTGDEETGDEETGDEETGEGEKVSVPFEGVKETETGERLKAIEPVEGVKATETDGRATSDYEEIAPDTNGENKRQETNQQEIPEETGGKEPIVYSGENETIPKTDGTFDVELPEEEFSAPARYDVVETPNWCWQPCYCSHPKLNAPLRKLNICWCWYPCWCWFYGPQVIDGSGLAMNLYEEPILPPVPDTQVPSVPPTL